MDCSGHETFAGSLAEHAHQEQEDDRAHDRHQESGGMKFRVGIWFADETSDKPADQRAHDPHEGGGDEPHLVDSGQHGSGNEAHHETHHEVPKEVEHGILPSRVSRSLQANLPGRQDS
jgi:hypothetical protein